jgi:hypothetical protein
MAAATSAMIAAAAAPAVAGVLGRMMSSGDRKEAERLANEAYAEIEALGLPPDQSTELMLEKFKSAGLYTPELEQEIRQTVSKTSEIKEDPRLKDAQMKALEMMQQTGRTGLNATDRAALNQIRQEVQRDAEAKRQQIMQSMQARGQAGGGAELAASLLSAQAGADQQSEAGDRIAAQAQERALQAMMQSGQLGGQVRGQDLDYNRTVAEAADEMERFNIQNAVNRQQRNVGARNQGQQMNLQQQQEIMNANTAMSNAEKQRQAQAARQYYNDLAARAQSRAQARLGQANLKAGNAADTAKMVQGIGSGVGAAAGAYANRVPQANPLTKTAAGADYMSNNYKINSPAPKINPDDLVNDDEMAALIKRGSIG